MITIGRESTHAISIQVNPDVSIGNFTSIGPDTTFWGYANYPSVANSNMVCNRGWLWKVASIKFNTSKGPIKVGHDVWIGQGCDILSGVTIGNGAIIGMRTVVSKDVPAYAVAVGHPMVIKHYRFPPEIVEKLQKIEWWNWSDQVIYNRSDDFLDINKFLEKYAK